MSATYRPLWDKIWVKKLEEQETTSPGGLVLPGKENKTFARGKVIVPGNGYLPHNGSYEKLMVSMNDIVIFGKYAGTDLGDGTIILKEDDILAIELQD